MEPMKSSHSLLLACTIALFGTLRVDAGSITFLTQTSTELTGTFSFTDSERLVSAPASIFGQLPGSDSEGSQRLFGERNVTDSVVTVQFGAQEFGIPMDPYFVQVDVLTPTIFPELLGTYTNSPSGRPVNFRFYGFTESSGTALGTFSGNFSFQAIDDNGEPEEPGIPTVPDSGSTLSFLGVALAGLGLIRRRLR